MRIIVAAILAALSFLNQAEAADRPWLFEFEFAVWVDGSPVSSPYCSQVSIIDPVRHPKIPRRHWPTDCGGGWFTYQHFLGRKCFNDRPRVKHLIFECGWRHKSHPGTDREIWWDALAFRGRFEF